MKSNINTSESKTAKGLVWYTWDEHCDRCGNQIHSAGDWKTTSEPKLLEEDFCLSCLRVIIDNKLKEK